MFGLMTNGEMLLKKVLLEEQDQRSKRKFLKVLETFILYHCFYGYDGLDCGTLSSWLELEHF